MYVEDGKIYLPTRINLILCTYFYGRVKGRIRIRVDKKESRKGWEDKRGRFRKWKGKKTQKREEL